MRGQIGHVHILDEGLHDLRALFVEGDADDLDALVFVFFMERLEVGGSRRGTGGTRWPRN